MPRPPQPSYTGRIFAVLTTVVVVAGLYWGRDFFIPLALAVLLSFLLSPLVNWLERWRLGRGLSVAVVSTLALGLIGALGWIVAGQVVDLARQLPQYKDDIAAKVARLSPRSGPVQRLREMAVEVQAKVDHGPTTAATTQTAAAPTPGDGAAAAAPAPPRRLSEDKYDPTQPPSLRNPVPVYAISPEPSPLGTLGHYLGLALGPLGTAGIVVVFVFFFLLQREDLRDRLIRLAGRGQFNLTIKALDEAATRISRYLLAQAIVNGAFGVAIGLSLWAIGHLLGDKPFPNVILWALLCGLLRFVPYLGTWIAGGFLAVVSFAVFKGYGVFAAAVGVWLTIELLVANVLEPFVYGSSTGMSAVAVLVAAVFWTFLWGPVGLLLATPLTVCLVVLGKYVPALGYLDILLGDEPALEPPVRLYQRLLAEDLEEATELVEQELKEHDLTDVYDRLVLPALALAEGDWHRGRLDDDQHRFVRQSIRDLAEDLGETHVSARKLEEQKERTGDVEAQSDGKSEENGEPAKRMTVPQEADLTVLCLPARDEADEIAAVMLAQLLRLHGLDGEVVSVTALASEMVERVASRQEQIVCVSALPPSAVTHARYLCKRLHARLPDVQMMVGLWTTRADLTRTKERFACEAPIRMTNSFAGAMEQIQQMIQPALVKAQKVSAKG